MHQQMHFSRVILLKIFVHFNPMDHATGQHAICLPALIILQEMYQKHSEVPQKATEITPAHQAWSWALHWQQDASNLVSLKVSTREEQELEAVQETARVEHMINRTVSKEMQDMQGSQNTSGTLTQSRSCKESSCPQHPLANSEQPQ